MSASSAAYSPALFQRHLVETDLFGALAGHFLEGDGLDPQMAHRQVVHVVLTVAFQYIGLQQGIVRDAVEFDAMVGQNVFVVFEVLADLADGRIFQQRFECASVAAKSSCCGAPA